MSGLTTRQLAGRRTRQMRVARSDQLQPGDVLQSRYRIVGVLGVGGFSSVYQARDLRFPNVTRLCAVKEIVNHAVDPEMRDLTTEAFTREANVLATFDHPAIPEVYDFFTEENRSYLVIEFIRGKDLEAMLSERNDPFPPDQVLDWALQVCDVLGYLHHHKPQPIIFRDLKPSNIMLDPHGRIRLIDFGIAKVFQTGEKGTMIGTEGYSPPEQYRGESSPAGDVYALGATLHHLLTGQDPQLETPFTFAERPLSATIPDIDPALERVVMRCLAYGPEERFMDGQVLGEALQGVADKRPLEHSGGAPTAVTPGADAPALTGQSIRPLWAFKCEDEIRSKAAVADGIVYTSVYDNNLYALNTGDGEFLWKYPASDGLASSPTVAADHIYIGSSDNHLYAIQRRTGALAWRYATEGAVYSSPGVQYDHVFFGSDDGHVYALHIVAGREVWKTEVHSKVRSSPAFGDDSLFIGTEGGYVFSLDWRGNKKWQFEASRGVTSTPVIADDIVFVGSLDSTVYALDAASGWAIWRFRARRPIVSSPVVHDNLVLIGSSDGTLYALDRYNGQKRWAFATEGQIASSPAIWKDNVYFGCTDGAVYCVTARQGKERWRFETGGMVISSPTIANNVLYIGSTDHHLYALPI